MKTKTKGLILSLCALLVVIATVIGTLAYLTDTDETVNTFTVGNVDIVLDEAKVNTKGEPIDKDGNKVDVTAAERVKSNDYHLIPGYTYVKDPTLTVKQNSEEAYVRMLVTFNKLKELDAIFQTQVANLTSIFNGYDATKWVYTGESEDAGANTITYEFRYYGTVNAEDADVKLDALFDSITIPGYITKEDLATLYVSQDDRFSITVQGNAIQAAGFDNADMAWAAFVNQNK